MSYEQGLQTKKFYENNTLCRLSREIRAISREQRLRVKQGLNELTALSEIAELLRIAHAAKDTNTPPS